MYGCCKTISVTQKQRRKKVSLPIHKKVTSTSRTGAHVIITNLAGFPFIFSKPNIFPSFARFQLAFFVTSGHKYSHQPRKYYVCEVVSSGKCLCIRGNNT